MAGSVITQTDITALAPGRGHGARTRRPPLQGMLDNMRHGIVVFGPDHRVLVANDLGNDLPGLPPGTVRPGLALADLTIGDAAAAGGDAPGQAMAAPAVDRSKPHRTAHTTPAGRTLDIASDPLPEGGFVISFVDTTELTAAQAEAQRGLLQTMQDSMRHGIALFGPDQRLIVANRLAAGLAGLPAEHMVPGMTAAEELARRQLVCGVFGQGPAATAEATTVSRRGPRAGPIRCGGTCRTGASWTASRPRAPRWRLRHHLDRR